MRPPNILLLLADQMRADCLGVVNPAIRTPHLDRLAREGLLGERVYAPTPVCLPCRASLVTGQYPSTHGATHNMARLPQDWPTLVAPRLARRGYDTHLIGKSHFSSCHDPSSPESAPHIHNRGHFRNWHGPWYGFQHADLSIGHSTEKHACGMHYGVWLEDRGVDTSRFFGHTSYVQYGPWDLPAEHHSSAWIAETAIAGIDRARDHGQPFFLWANFQDPHNPCMVPEPWASMYDPEAIPRFGFKPGEPECFAEKPAFYGEVIAQPGDYAARPSDPDLPGAGNIAHLDWTPRQTQENAACYYGMVSLMDHHIGRILAHLDASGLAEDTLVVFSSDHGDLLGDHGFWWKSLVSYEEGIRVPFLARWPARIPAGTRTRAFCNLVDLPATFCAAAGLGEFPDFEGVDQLPAWTSPGTAVRQDCVVEERPTDHAFVQRILLTDDWKLVFYAGRPWGELYDLRDDPHHVRNLWDAPAQQVVKQAMIARLLAHEVTKRQPHPGWRRQAAIDAR